MCAALAVKLLAGHDVDRLIAALTIPARPLRFLLLFTSETLSTSETFMFTIIGAFAQRQTFDQAIQRFGSELFAGMIIIFLLTSGLANPEYVFQTTSLAYCKVPPTNSNVPAVLRQLILDIRWQLFLRRYQ